MKFSIRDCSSKCDQICSFLRSWSHLLEKSLMENFIFCAVMSLHIAIQKFHSSILSTTNCMIYLLFQNHTHSVLHLVMIFLLPKMNWSHKLPNWLNFGHQLRCCVKVGRLVISCPKSVFSAHYVYQIKNSRFLMFCSNPITLK